MPQRSAVLLEPRKAPVQERSAASVDAILEATLQVLRQVGKERLTTTRVAERAGVSVGTLYQYFPNKSALLQAVLRRHMGGVATAVEAVCKEQQGQTLRTMVTALVRTFVEAKIRDGRSSVALYAVSADVDGARIAQQMGVRSDKAITRMLESSCEPLVTDPLLVGSMLHSTLAGVSRRMLEAGALDEQVEALRKELIVVACAYVEACAAPVGVESVRR